MNKIKIVLTALAILVSSSVGLAQAKDEGREPEICAHNPAEAEENPVIAELVGTFGGVQKMNGHYKLAGLAGEVASVRVSFFADEKSFSVKANKDPIKTISLCYVEAAPNQLRVRVKEPLDPRNGLLLVKPVTTEGKTGIYIANNISKWKFHRFKRVTVPEAIAATSGAPTTNP